MPTLKLERTFIGMVAGIDEAGRGPWAGPVVAAAVILETKGVPRGINDSKKLPREKREELYLKICERHHVGIAHATVEEIDTHNILGATKLAMQRAFSLLKHTPVCALVDGNQPPALPCETRAVIGGDGISLSIAAASIVAKVTRDRMMAQLHEEFPHYGWHTNAGYGTDHHQRALAEHGVTAHHRRSFAPIRKLLEEAVEA